MSYKINKNGEWVTVANGSRIFVGTTAAIDAAIARGELAYPDLYADISDYESTNADGELSLTTASGTITKQLYARREDTFFIRVNITLTAEVAAGGVFYCTYSLPVTLTDGFGMPLHGVAEQSSIGDVPVTGYASQTELYITTSVALPVGTVVEFFGEAPIAI